MVDRSVTLVAGAEVAVEGGPRLPPGHYRAVKRRFEAPTPSKRQFTAPEYLIELRGRQIVAMGGTPGAAGLISAEVDVSRQVYEGILAASTSSCSTAYSRRQRSRRSWIAFKGGRRPCAARRPHRRRRDHAELGGGPDSERRPQAARHQLRRARRVFSGHTDVQGAGLQCRRDCLARRHGGEGGNAAIGGSNVPTAAIEKGEADPRVERFLPRGICSLPRTIRSKTCRSWSSVKSAPIAPSCRAAASSKRNEPRLSLTPRHAHMET